MFTRSWKESLRNIATWRMSKCRALCTCWRFVKKCIVSKQVIVVIALSWKTFVIKHLHKKAVHSFDDVGCPSGGKPFLLRLYLFVEIKFLRNRYVKFIYLLLGGESLPRRYLRHHAAHRGSTLSIPRVSSQEPRGGAAMTPVLTLSSQLAHLASLASQLHQLRVT